jgi:Tfp pilus assembly protein FimT
MSRVTEHRVIYTGIMAVLIALLVWGVASFRQHQQSAAATAKAQELTSELRAADLPAPNRSTIARLLGTSGGVVCSTSGSDAARGLLKLSLFVNAGSPGARPVVVSSAFLRGGELIIKTYCPEQLESYQQFLSQLRYADTVDIG